MSLLRSILLILAVAASLPGLGASPAALPAAGDDTQAGGRVTEMQQPGALGAVEERRLRFLFWAYVAIWILLAAYLVSLWARLGSVRRELDRLHRRLDARGQG